MKWLITLVFTLCLFPYVHAQGSNGTPLNFMSYAVKLCVTPDEALILNTRAGEVGITTSLEADWRRADPVTSNIGLRPTLDQANFFNKDTGFVSGFIQGPNGRYNIIYHTIDGGKRWKTINFGQDGWVDDAVNLNNGEAWLSVGGSGIAYTNDYGFTWQKFEIPEIKQRFANIFFNSKHQGVIGSLWNLLAITDNNCKTWTYIPTPLDQIKYKKTNKSSRPEINQVAIFQDYLLVRQEDLVFYSKRDSINWIWLPDYENFYTDPENSALFFKTKKGYFIKADLKLQPIYSSEKIEQDFDSQCRNGNLFIICRDKTLKIKPNNTITISYFQPKPTSGFQPSLIGYTINGQYGIHENKVYLQKGYGDNWHYEFTLPIAISNGTFSIIENNVLLFNRNDDSLFYFSLKGKALMQKSKSTMINSFCKAGINKLIFSRGSYGCFHNYSDQLIYTYQNGGFDEEIGITSATSKRIELPDNDQNIDESSVSSFVSKIPSIFDSSTYASIEDLGFTEKELQKCKEDIQQFKKAVEQNRENKKSDFYFNKNNIDFNRLFSLVDSVKFINKPTLNEILFNINEVWSTTTNWTKIELINNQNEKLTISSTYNVANAFYFPWQVSLNGYSQATTNTAINNFIKEVYPALLNSRQRINVLHTIVKKLY